MSDIDSILNKAFAKFGLDYKVGSRAWTDRVGALLRDGYGVEDIAIKMSCEAHHVRREVSLLRGRGLLRKWWKK